MTRVAMMATFVFLTIAVALDLACESRHVDMYFGTDAGADFDAPPREAAAPTEAGATDAGAAD